MKSKTPFPCFLAALAVVAAPLHAALVITPTGATSTTTIGSGDRVIDHTIDGSGLVDVSDPSSVLDDFHPYVGTSAYWLSASTAVADGTEELTFDLGGIYDVDTVYYWLYTRDADRPLRTFDISYSTDGGGSFSSPVSAASLNMADWSIGPGNRSDAYVESRTFDTLSGVTNIRFSNLQNHGDPSYFALAEIRFGNSTIPEPSASLLVSLIIFPLLLRRRG